MFFITDMFQPLSQSYRIIYKTYKESQTFPRIVHTSIENTGCTLTTYSNASSFLKKIEFYQVLIANKLMFNDYVRSLRHTF